jgi:hypothetical protein
MSRDERPGSARDVAIAGSTSSQKGPDPPPQALQIQKVSAQLEASKSSPQIVANKR